MLIHKKTLLDGCITKCNKNVCTLGSWDANTHEVYLMETNNKGCQEVKDVTNKRDAKFATSLKMSKQSRDRLSAVTLALAC